MQYSKAEILEGYLNTLYYGHGVYGVRNAAKFFFDKELKELDTAQVAMLISIPNGPSLYSPYLHPDYAKSRQELILSILAQRELISEQEYQEAKAEVEEYLEEFRRQAALSDYEWAVEEIDKTLNHWKVF